MGYTTAQAKEFINKIAPLMVAEAKARGYTIVSTAIAQAIIEGAAGTSKLAKDYHNHFGLKCGKAWLQAGKPSVNMKTKEEYTVGTLSTINDYFRVYTNDAEGVKGYYDFINTSRYANLKAVKNYVEYANMLKNDGYATSSTYVNTLCSTVMKYNLERYDNGEVPSEYVVGQTYTLQTDMYVRKTPNGANVEFDELSDNAKSNGYEDASGFGILKKGTRVTCKEVVNLPKSIWIKIPSGYICAKNSKTKYVS